MYSPGIRGFGTLGVLGWQVSPWGVGGSTLTALLAVGLVLVGYLALWRTQTAADTAA